MIFLVSFIGLILEIVVLRANSQNSVVGRNESDKWVFLVCSLGHYFLNVVKADSQVAGDIIRTRRTTNCLIFIKKNI